MYLVYDKAFAISQGNISMPSMASLPADSSIRLAMLRVKATATDPTSTVSVTITDGMGFSYSTNTLSISETTSVAYMTFPVSQAVSMTTNVSGSGGGYEINFVVF